MALDVRLLCFEWKKLYCWVSGCDVRARRGRRGGIGLATGIVHAQTDALARGGLPLDSEGKMIDKEEGTSGLF